MRYTRVELPGCGMQEARALTHLMVMAYGKN